MTTKLKPVRFRLEQIGLVDIGIPMKNIPLGWKCLRALAVPVNKKLGVKFCAMVVDPIRYKKNIKFRKKVMAKLKREIQKSYNLR